MADSHEVLPATAIPAGQMASLVVLYREARFAQIRSCGNVAKFIPHPGRSYNVHFRVTGQGESCEIHVEDELLGPAPLEPVDTCYAQFGQGKRPIPNGMPLFTDITATFQRYP